MTVQTITPAARPLNAVAYIPGSKSITNRALLLAALADGTSTLAGVLFSDDSHWFLDGLQRLGVAVDIDRERHQVRVHGVGGPPPAQDATLWVELAGTAARFLLAYCCLGQGHYMIDGNARMRQRPMDDLLATLGALGAECYGTGTYQGLPITVAGRGLRGGAAGLAGDKTSQFLSALLMVAPYARADVELTMTSPLAATRNKSARNARSMPSRLSSRSDASARVRSRHRPALPIIMPTPSAVPSTTGISHTG